MTGEPLTLAELRRSRGLTQVEVAARLGWAQSQVSRFERTAGDRRRVSTIAAYIAALGGTLVLGAVFADTNEYVRIRLGE